MASNKDSKVRLLIEADDLSTAAFKDVEKAVSGLSEAINKQVAAAKKGEVSLHDLAQQMADLKQAGTALAKQEQLITQFNSMQEASGKLAAKLEATKKAAADYAASLDTNGKVTAAQTNKLERFSVAITRVEAAQTKQNATLAAQREKLTAAGLDVTNLDQQYQQLVTTAQGVGQALTAANAAQRANGEVLRDNAAAAKLAAQAQREQKDALTTALAPTKNILQQKAIEAKAAIDAEKESVRQFNTELANALAPVRYVAQQAKLRDEAEAGVLAFQQAGRKAVETATSYQLLASASTRLTGASSGAARAIQSILDPAALQRSSFAGLIEQVNDLGNLVNNIKGPIEGYETILARLTSAQTSIASKAGLIDAFQNQMQAVRAARAEFVAARAELIRLGRAQAQATAPSDEMAAATKRAQTAANAAKNAFVTEYEAAIKLRAGLRDAGLSSDRLAAQQEVLAVAARKTVASTASLQGSFSKFGRSQAGSGIFGLSPYAVQNLGFQINDVITSLASGIKPTQVLAQQGGQILQVFPRAFSAIAARLPVIIPFVVVLGTAFGAVARAMNDIAANREFTAFLASNSDGLRYQSETLVKIQRDLIRYGMSGADAMKLIRDAIDQGFRQDKIEAIGKLVQDFATVRKIGVPEAFKAISGALDGGMTSIRDFNKEYNAFTTEQLNSINTLYNTGRALEAQQMALDILSGKYQESADKARGPWSQAWRDLKNAISDVLEWLSKTGPVRILIALFDNLADTISKVSRAISNLTKSDTPLQAAQATLVKATSNVQSVKDDIAAGAYGSTSPTKEEQDRLAAAVQLMKDAKARVDELAKAEKAGADASRDGAKATGLKNEGTNRQIELDRAAIQAAKDAVGSHTTQTDAIRLETAARLARNKALEAGASADAADQAAAIARADVQATLDKEHKAAGDRRLNRERSLANQISSLISAAASKDVQTLETRLSSVDEKYQKIFRAIAEFRRQGGTQVNGVPLDQLEGQVRAQEEILKQQESMKFYEEQIAAKRKESSDTIGAVLDQQKAGLISGQDAIQRITDISAKLAPSIKQSATAALAMAEGFRTAVPNPRLEAFIAQMQRVAGTTPAGGVPAGAATASPDDMANVQKSLKIAQDKVKELIRARDDAAKTNQELATGGTIGQGQADTMNKALFADAAPQIQAAADAYKNVADAAKDAKAITDSQWQTASALARKYGADVNYVSEAQRKAAATFERAFGSAASELFDSLATSLGNLIVGTESLGDFLKDAGNAALKFGADLLKAIAMAIIQEQALIIAKSISRALGFHGGGVVGHGSGQQTFTGISPLAFAGAPRYHDGSFGPLGLRSDEMPAVLQRGEEVLSRTDPRNILNGGLKSANNDNGPGLSIRNVLAVDPNFIQNQLQSRQGERTILTFLKTNAPAVKSILGVK